MGAGEACGGRWWGLWGLVRLVRLAGAGGMVGQARGEPLPFQSFDGILSSGSI